MKQNYYYLAILLGFCFLPGLGLAQNTETRNLDNFEELRVKGAFYVTLVPSDKNEIELKSERFPLDEIKTEISKKGILRISRKIDYLRSAKYLGEDNVSMPERVRVLVKFKSLKEIRNAGSGSTRMEEAYSCDELTLRSLGSGSLSLAKLECNALRAHVSGSGKVKVKAGKCTDLEVRVSGSGLSDFKNVKAENNTTRVSGSGDVYVQVEKKLEIKISGSGRVHYKGQPSVVSSKASGSGKVYKMQSN